MNVRRAREPMGAWQARRGHQEPPCFDGNDTVKRLRPFFRRRESTARPQRVAIRARNPCLLIRRLFRGRYDGFIRGLLPSEPGKLAGGEAEGEAKRTEEAGEGMAGEKSSRLVFQFRCFRTFRFFRHFPPCQAPIDFSTTRP